MTLHEMSISDIQQALSAGELSAHEIARQTLEAIARVNPQIGAWTTVTEARMLAEADNIDTLRREKRPLPPLAGVPYAVKNLFDVAGHTTLAGAELFSQRPAAAADSFAVRQLRSAGGLLTGMVNMDAYAYGFTTENSHYGATRNPHDLTRIAGGSSGGSAAAVAAGLVHFSLGTDTNGSIRVPASLCGIYGLKPTFGRLSRSGIISAPSPAAYATWRPCTTRCRAGTPATVFRQRARANRRAPCLTAGLTACAARCSAATSPPGATRTPETPWREWRRRSTCRMSFCFLTPSWRAPRRLSSAPPRVEISTCPRFAGSPSVLSRTPANACWPGR